MAKAQDRRYARRVFRREEWARAYQLYYLAVRRDILKRGLTVTIPYATEISRQLPVRPVKARRLLELIFTIVRTVAIVRRPHHRVLSDGNGAYIEADSEDWRQASEVVNLLLANSLSVIDKQALQVLEDIREKLGSLPQELTVPRVCDLLGVSDSVARRRLKQLVEAGVLECDSAYPQGGRGKVARYYPVDTPASHAGAVQLPVDLSQTPPAAESSEGLGETEIAEESAS
jgi:hypothetical protein